MSDDAGLLYLSIYLGEDGHTVMAAFSPEGDVEEITLNLFRRVVDAAGFGECDLDEDALIEATGNYNDGGPFELSLGIAVDGVFSIKTDENFLNAYLTCTPPRGGRVVTPENVIEEAKSKLITVGLDMQAIERSISEGGEDALIARGIAVIEGADGVFESLIPDMKERVPQIDAEGIANFRDLGEIIVVYKGDSLLRRHQAKDGIPGLSLSGETIPAKMGMTVEFSTVFEGAEIDIEDVDLLIASIDGCPYLLENGVKVEPIYTVKDVDLHTGNIDFLGTVNVTGGVQPGMTIKAVGDVHIKGTIEGAVILANGDVIVGGGVIGHSDRVETDTSIDSRIECGGSFSSNFTQAAKVKAGDCIYIRDYTMMSELTANHGIIVGADGKKGHIIGGVSTAGLLIKGNIIGSPVRSRTVVIMRPSRDLATRMNDISEARDAAKVQRSKVIKLLDLAAKKPDLVPEASAKSAVSTRDQIDAQFVDLDLKQEELEKEIEASRNGRVTAVTNFFEGVDVRFGSQRRITNIDREGGTYRVNSSNELVYD